MCVEFSVAAATVALAARLLGHMVCHKRVHGRRPQGGMQTIISAQEHYLPELPLELISCLLCLVAMLRALFCDTC